jgi:hypothetical protein
MAAASSISTFLDVTAPSASGAENETPTRAKVLVTVGADWEAATAIAERAGLQLGEALEALGWLEQNKLVNMRKDDDGIQVRLTEWARESLRKS